MKFIALLALLITSVALADHSGPTPDFGSMQVGGNHSCPPNKCLGGFETYGYVRPKVLTFLDCNPGGGLCQLGLKKFVLAHVTPIGTRGDPSSQYDVVFHLVTNPDGSKILAPWSITASCQSPGVHIKGEWNLD